MTWSVYTVDVNLKRLDFIVYIFCFMAIWARMSFKNKEKCLHDYIGFYSCFQFEIV